MVLLNGEPFLIYSIDTNETIKRRIAYTFKTAPKYVYVNEYDQSDVNANIIADNLIKLVKKDVKNPSSDLLDFYEKIKERFSKINIEEITYLWLKYWNKQYKGK